MIIPWHKMPIGVTEAISKKARPQPSDRRALINLVVDEMLLCHPNPNLKQVTIIAKRIVQMYPESFEDRADEGHRIGTGCASLVKQLKYRIENETRGNTSVRLRRPKHTKGMENDNPSTPPCAPRQSRQPSDSYGCINWHPRNLPDNETRDTLQASQLSLLEQHKMGPNQWNPDQINDLMKKTYCLVRYDINGGSTTAEVFENWPFLFHPKWCIQHFEELVGVVVAHVMESCKEKTQRLYNYAHDSKLSSKVRASIEHILESQISHSDVRCLPVLLFALFDEDASAILIHVDVSICSSLSFIFKA